MHWDLSVPWSRKWCFSWLKVSCISSPFSLWFGRSTSECLFSTHSPHSHFLSYFCPALSHPGCALLAGSSWRQGREGGKRNSSHFLLLSGALSIFMSPSLAPTGQASALQLWLSLDSGTMIPSPHPSDLRTAKVTSTECFSLLFHTLNPSQASVHIGTIWGWIVLLSLSDPDRAGKGTDIYQYLLYIRRYTRQFYTYYVIYPLYL